MLETKNNAVLKVTLLASELTDIIRAVHAYAERHENVWVTTGDEKAKRMAKHLYALAGRLDDKVRQTQT